MKALLLNVKENKVELVQPNDFEDFYKLIGCRVVEIVERVIAGSPYSIICDEEGLYVENPRISALDGKGQPMLVGNLIITRIVNDEGDMRDLTDADIQHIKKNIYTMIRKDIPTGYCVLCNVTY